MTISNEEKNNKKFHQQVANYAYINVNQLQQTFATLITAKKLENKLKVIKSVYSLSIEVIWQILDISKVHIVTINILHFNIFADVTNYPPDQTWKFRLPSLFCFNSCYIWQVTFKIKQ